MRILVTGSAGFIGWKVSEKLLERGDVVVGVDDLNDYYDVKLKKWRLSQLKKFPSFEFHQIDIENFETLNRLFTNYSPSSPPNSSNTILNQPDKPFDAIINLAARVGVRASIKNPHIYYTTNVLGSMNLLELCRDFGVSKFVLASTSSLYAGQSIPFKEDLAVNTPICPYAASKKAAEVLTYTYHHLYSLDVSILRYFTVYGPAGRPDMSYFRFISWIDQGKPVIIYGDGSQSRDFTYVDDIAHGTIAALKLAGFEIINLGGDRPHKLIDVLHIIERKSGKKAKIVYEPFHPADLKTTWADVTKAKNVLGWEPKKTIEDGMESTIRWYREYRRLAAALKL